MSTRRLLFLAPAQAITGIFPPLRDAGYELGIAENLKGASVFIRKSGPGVIFARPSLPGFRVEDLLAVSAEDPNFPPVIVTTDKGSPEEAERLLGLGARDYWLEPLDVERIMAVAREPRKAAPVPASSTLGGHRPQYAEGQGGPRIVGRHPAIARVLQLARQVAASKATVLITGESGTGKELVARAIHYTSPRKDKPFVSVNCMALNPGVLESELFGHEKGSFTGAVAMRRGRFEQADGGTLFLDEIAELTPDLQVKLLRVLQERKFERVGGGEEIEVDIRVVAATNKDLAAMVEKGTFRDDLYYRLNVVQIPLPPLRERREDIPLLVAHFVEKVVADNNMPSKTFSTEALNYLTGYEWPGNIRQLENVVESCLVLVPGSVIEVDNLPAEIRDEESQFKSAVDLLPVQLDLADTLEKIEAALIRRALVRADLVQVKAAEYLGISKSLLQYKLKKYGITGH